MNSVSVSLENAYIDHPAQSHVGIKAFPDKLHVLCVLENPLRRLNLYRNYHSFQKHVEDSGAVLWTAEIALGDRVFQVTDYGNPHNLQLRTEDIIMHKENAQNLLAWRLPPSANYIACIDADMEFTRSNWAQETLHKLQEHDVVQMFSHIIDLGPDFAPLNTAGASMGTVWLQTHKRKVNDFGSPGGAWAYKRQTFQDLGGMLDWNILGQGDWLMAKALYGELPTYFDMFNPRYSKGYETLSLNWQNLATRHIRSVGYVEATMIHHWHGPRVKRGYGLKPILAIESQFDPITDLKRDCQGLWSLTGNNKALAQGLREVADARDEDATTNTYKVGDPPQS